MGEVKQSKAEDARPRCSRLRSSSSIGISRNKSRQDLKSPALVSTLLMTRQSGHILPAPRKHPIRKLPIGSTIIALCLALSHLSLVNCAKPPVWTSLRHLQDDPLLAEASDEQRQLFDAGESQKQLTDIFDEVFGLKAESTSPAIASSKTSWRQVGARAITRAATSRAWSLPTSTGNRKRARREGPASRATVRRHRSQPASSSQTRASARSELLSQPQAREVNNSMDKKCALILLRNYLRRADDGGSSTSDHDSNDPFSVDDGFGTLQAPQTVVRQDRICISYDDVNTAIAEAKQKRSFGTVPANDINSIETSVATIAKLGELNQEVTKILTQRFDLAGDEIIKGLPLIDMSRTDFWPICPLMVKPITCDSAGRFRSFTGHCNNLKNPSWGASQMPFARYLEPAHPDGIQMERTSVVDGSPLPSPRLVTSTVHRDHDSPSSDLSLLIMVWGQILDHDVALAAPPRDERGMDFNCCKRQHPNCKPIEIPENDHFYSKFNQRCMDFKRSLAGLRPNCALGPRVHINTITSTIDANTIYGSTKGVADQLRTFSGGKLKVQDAFAQRQMKPLLPKQLDKPDLDCFGRPRNTHCFLAGDERVNEQPTLTAMHTLYVRDHNRIAERLAELNPHWDDDRIYHETRHIEAATIQHLLVSEYLPLLIGQNMMNLFNLTESAPNSYASGYDETITPAISHGFSTAAFRQGHTFIQGRVRLHDATTHEFIGSEMLRSLFKRPFHYYKPGRMDQVLAGIVNTPAQVYDPFITEDISGHLFQEPGEQYGMDLPAINIARGREQGTPGYNAWREWCGMPKMKSFADLQPFMSNSTAFHYSRLYKHVDDIDLWSAGVSERRMPGAQIGPTFACIIARQFANIKKGDRFWFEYPGFPSSLTLDQINEIKKTSQARLICHNSDNIQMIQRQALRLPHPVFNPRVPCSNIPDIDLEFWREDPAQPASFHSKIDGTGRIPQ